MRVGVELCKLALAALSLTTSFAAAGAHDNQFPIKADKNDKRPNIVFIITDDQDIHMQSLDYVPLIQKHLLDEGTFYSRHYCTVAVCCPSRVNLWTGLAAHNSNVTDLSPPYGE
jgi:hypothetical protein